MKEKKFIVVTGASGFIGSGVVRYLNDRGYHHLLLVDDLKKGDKWKNLVGKQFVDCISKQDLFSWLVGREKEIAAFVHLGACSNTCEIDAGYLLENNYRFSVRLAEYAFRHNVRFIYASSAATYGNGSLGFSDDHQLLQKLKPLNMYGFSKHLFDLWLLREGLLEKAVGLKYFNVFGPNEYHKGPMSSMIYKMTDKVVKNGVIHLFRSNDPRYGDGEQQRDFIYVKEAVQMTCLFLEKEYWKVGGIFNIGRGEGVTWNRLARALFLALGKEPNVEYIEMPIELSKQYQNYTCAEMGKFLHVSAMPKRTIEEAVKDYVQNYLLQDERW